MRLTRLLKGAPLIGAVILGVSLSIWLLGGGPAVATAVDKIVLSQDFGWSASNEGACVAVYYLDGSETVALTLDEKREFNWDWASIMYETASDVWRIPTADVTLKDSDSDGYIDWLGFTATGGATAGGEVRIRGIAVERDLPAI